MNLDRAWTNKKVEEFLQYLKSISEEKYKEFNQRIISTKYEMLGIRLPKLRKIANEISKTDIASFLKITSNDYYEVVLIKGLVIAKIKNVDECLKYFHSYLDLIDNWAITDSFCNSLKIVAKNKDTFRKIIKELIQTKSEYIVRVGLILLLNYYVEKEELPFVFEMINISVSNAYYINMARAWLLCEVFVKYQKETLAYLDKFQLDKFTINKAISKIRDSYRVTKEIKEDILKYKKEV